MTSNRELARQLGVSETAVRQAEKAGRIRREADGSWDPAKVKAAWARNTDQTQQRTARSGRPTGKQRAIKPVPEAAVGAVRDTLREHGEPVPAGGMTFMQARTANEVLTRIVKGFPRGSWEKEPGRRNEALDCRVYARGAAAIYGLDRFEERRWRRMEEALARTVERDDHDPAWPGAPLVRPSARRVIHSGYMAR